MHVSGRAAALGAICTAPYYANLAKRARGKFFYLEQLSLTRMDHMVVEYGLPLPGPALAPV